MESDVRGWTIRPFGILGPVVRVGYVGMAMYGASWVVVVAAIVDIALLPDGWPLPRWQIVVGGFVVTVCLQLAILFIGKRVPPEPASTAASFD